MIFNWLKWCITGQWFLDQGSFNGLTHRICSKSKIRDPREWNVGKMTTAAAVTWSLFSNFFYSFSVSLIILCSLPTQQQIICLLGWEGKRGRGRNPCAAQLAPPVPTPSACSPDLCLHPHTPSQPHTFSPTHATPVMQPHALPDSCCLLVRLPWPTWHVLCAPMQLSWHALFPMCHPWSTGHLLCTVMPPLQSMPLWHTFLTQAASFGNPHTPRLLPRHAIPDLHSTSWAPTTPWYPSQSTFLLWTIPYQCSTSRTSLWPPHALFLSRIVLCIPYMNHTAPLTPCDLHILVHPHFPHHRHASYLTLGTSDTLSNLHHHLHNLLNPDDISDAHPHILPKPHSTSYAPPGIITNLYLHAPLCALSLSQQQPLSCLLASSLTFSL